MCTNLYFNFSVCFQFQFSGARSLISRTVRFSHVRRARNDGSVDAEIGFFDGAKMRINDYTTEWPRDYCALRASPPICSGCCSRAVGFVRSHAKMIQHMQ